MILLVGAIQTLFALMHASNSMIKKRKATDNYQHCLSLSWSKVDDDDETKKQNDRLEKRLIKLLASHFFSQFILDQA